MAPSAAAAQGGRCRQGAPFRQEQRHGALRSAAELGAALGSPASLRGWGEVGERGSRRSAAPPRRTHQAHAPGQHQQPGHRHSGTETLRGDEIETTFSHSGPHRHRSQLPAPPSRYPHEAEVRVRPLGEAAQTLACCAAPLRHGRRPAPQRRPRAEGAPPPRTRVSVPSGAVSACLCVWEPRRNLVLSESVTQTDRASASGIARPHRRSASVSCRQRLKAERTQRKPLPGLEEEQNDFCRTAYSPDAELSFDEEFS